MDDPYQHYLSSMSRVGMQQLSAFPNIQLPAFQASPLALGSSPVAEFYPQASGLYQTSQEPAMHDGSKSKSRKKSAMTASSDTVKHRRTRSGCFTCRSRRVKCDEKRPVCERCSKGGRECVYPDPPSKKSGTLRASRSKDSESQAGKPSPSSSTGEPDDKDELKPKLEPILDEEELEESTEASASKAMSYTTATPPISHGPAERLDSETPSFEGTSRSSPSSFAEAPTSHAPLPFGPQDFNATDEYPGWGDLPSDYQQHLHWFHENITHYHYGLPIDTDDFFKAILPQAARWSEPLLNALTAFSAYQQTIQDPNGKLSDFLGYYNRSIKLLLEVLQTKQKHNVTTLMTILQIAQIEEYLGDWVNILGHQQAALEIFTNIFTPQTVMQTPVGRMCFSWYARFDGFMAFMGSFMPGLSKNWFDSMRNFFTQQMTRHPDGIKWIMADRSTRIRQISWQQALLYSKRNNDQLSDMEFAGEHDRLTAVLREYRQKWHPAIEDSQYLVRDFGGQQPEPDDIVNPYEPGILYEEPLFSTTIAAAEWHSVMIMHLVQSPNLTPAIFKELSEHAYQICRYYETVQYSPHTPKGAMTQLQSVVQTAPPFLPKDAKHYDWIRRKSAYSESTGCIRPLKQRERMAELFQDPSCIRWWLPNDEGFTPVLQRIRDFADERNIVALNSQQESVREVRHLYQKFGSMDVESSTPTSATGATGRAPPGAPS